MKIYPSVFLSFALLFSQHIFAHSDHAHGPISALQAASITIDVAKQLAVKDVGLDIGKLPASWSSVPKENVAIYKKGKGYYIVSAENKTERKILYVLMSFDGKVYDANFSGVFKGIE